ncbi:MAG TPA: MurT ligase domain-containing protein, partial [Bacilli bacterium]|nr:MurT ligase domain-containing protein [Bacilli bacterium]
MKKTFRFFFALYCSKIVQAITRLFFNERGTNLPGKIALKLCPNFLKIIKKPNIIIMVTGTNGKTSVSNFINDIFRKNHISTVNNSKGSNLNYGIASSLIQKSNILGNVHKEVGIFEIDERASKYTFEDIIPNYLICTNLFRDSIKRNGHSEFILEKLNEGLPKETVLILNADDLISINLGKENKKIYFSVKGDNNKYNDIVKDISVCPKCKNKLVYEYRHYHHIGKAKCSNCNFKSPKSDFSVIKIDKENNLFIIEENNKNYVYELISDSIFNIYNMLSAIVVSRLYGLSHENIYKAFKETRLKKDRVDRRKIHDKEVITMLSKNQNPISCSRMFNYIKEEKGKKLVILFVTDSKDKKHGSEDISWIYDTDFEYLKDDDINQIIVAGTRYLDILVRLELAGISSDKIVGVED